MREVVRKKEARSDERGSTVREVERGRDSYIFSTYGKSATVHLLSRDPPSFQCDTRLNSLRAVCVWVGVVRYV